MDNAPKCPECRVPLRRVKGPYGPYLICSRWPKCDIGVTLHRTNGKPMGEPADKATRQMRRRAHAAFDPIWLHADERTGVWNLPEPERSRQVRRIRREARAKAYEWLARELGVEEAHIGSMDIEQCERVIALAQARLQQRTLP